MGKWINNFVQCLYTEDMSGFMNALQKFFTKDRVIILVIFILLAVFLLYYSTGKTTVMDSMSDGGPSQDDPKKKMEDVVPSVAAPQPSTDGFTTQDTVDPIELLPKDENSQWATLNPSAQGSDMKSPSTPDLLKVGHHIGTVAQTLKNPNLQLRSDPLINKSDVGPWNQSTVEPDLMRVPLEVGSTCPK